MFLLLDSPQSVQHLRQHRLHTARHPHRLCHLPVLHTARRLRTIRQHLQISMSRLPRPHTLLRLPATRRPVQTTVLRLHSLLLELRHHHLDCLQHLPSTARRVQIGAQHLLLKEMSPRLSTPRLPRHIRPLVPNFHQLHHVAVEVEVLASSSLYNTTPVSKNKKISIRAFGFLACLAFTSTNKDLFSVSYLEILQQLAFGDMHFRRE
jgi:hypothetical protein